MATPMDRVVPLDNLDDFEIAEGDPDVRGWEVLGSDGRKIGSVDNLLIDTAAMKVRYLDVDLDEGLIEAGNDRHVLIPIGYARLDEDDDQIFVDAMASTDVTGLPEYSHEPLTREYEATVRQRFDTDFDGEAEVTAETDFYEHDLYDEDRFYGSRRELDEGEESLTLSEEELAVGTREVAAGEVEIDKDVETRHVRENVPTRHEEVVVERRPATGMTEPRIEDEEVHVPVSEEELVVEKRAVPKEELVVKKQEVVEDETVEADLRRERAEIHEEGDLNVRGDR